MHHVTARAVSGRLLFADDDDHLHYLRLLARQVAARDWVLLTWCHMPNHVHLLLETPRPNLGPGMKVVHERFATYLNERYERHGHVFGDRFHNRLVLTDAHYVACLRYVARNPVGPGLCARPSDWPWSAHRALVGLEPPPPFLDAAGALVRLDRPTLASARTRYAQLVATGDRELAHALLTGRDGDAGLAEALDVHRIPIRLLAELLGVSEDRAYRRAAAARTATLTPNQGTVP
jgi:REP element-mobilizing transposase RayT